MIDLAFASPSLTAFMDDLDAFCDAVGYPRVTQIDEAGNRVLPPCQITGSTRVDIDWIDNLVGVPGEYDADGNEIAAPIMRGPHANVRLSEADPSNPTGAHAVVAQAIAAWFAPLDLAEWDTPAAMKAKFGLSQARQVRKTTRASVRFDPLPVVPKRVWA